MYCNFFRASLRKNGQRDGRRLKYATDGEFKCPSFFYKNEQADFKNKKMLIISYDIDNKSCPIIFLGDFYFKLQLLFVSAMDGDFDATDGDF